MRAMVEAEGFWASYLRCQVLKTALSRDNIIIYIL
jgi:predicted tellurium resistance membrane protein TerC